MLIFLEVNFLEGFVDILYVATNQGNVFKMINLISINDFYNKNISINFLQDKNDDPVVPVAIYRVSEVILIFYLN